MDKKLHETTNICVEIMKSKRQGKEKLGYVRGTNSRLPLDVNVILETLRSRFAIPRTAIRGLRLAVSRYRSAPICLFLFNRSLLF